MQADRYLDGSVILTFSNDLDPLQDPAAWDLTFTSDLGTMNWTTCDIAANGATCNGPDFALHVATNWAIAAPADCQDVDGNALIAPYDGDITGPP